MLPFSHRSLATRTAFLAVLGLSVVGSAFTSSAAVAAETKTLLNVSYDPTRELYADVSKHFSAFWKAKTGEEVTVRSSHGGSGAQARAVIDGLEADVVTLGLTSDIDAIADRTDLIPKDWRSRLPNGSAPYTSRIVFVVRQGNPKGTKDWSDLIRPGISIITPNPKTSAGARWNYLAAWGYVLKQPGGTDEKARAFVKTLYSHVAVLDTGARGATITFAQRRQGDVLIAWEDDAHLAVDSLGKNSLQIVYPSITIVAEPAVSLVDKIADRHGTRAEAQGFLEYLFSPEGQRIIAQHDLRPVVADVASQFAGRFPPVPSFTVDEVFGGWSKAQPLHFGDGGIFDQITAGAN